ncbi:hypothetical protein GDO86_001752 [Hymenochirus boettgeri]|uniref:Uncharacterized protein n=1 Tax=Hymenochirus boettgeri TaxID=247094 RepID=A0A8T2KMS3_9PIPI|nr:hypothetical protein GDO86_001752 [Hymenochirus boettgeri]
MADTEEAYGMPDTPVEPDPKELQCETKQDNPIGATSKTPTSPQAAFTQQCPKIILYRIVIHNYKNSNNITMRRLNIQSKIQL